MPGRPPSRGSANGSRGEFMQPTGRSSEVRPLPVPCSLCVCVRVCVSWKVDVNDCTFDACSMVWCLIAHTLSLCGETSAQAVGPSLKPNATPPTVLLRCWLEYLREGCVSVKEGWPVVRSNKRYVVPSGVCVGGHSVAWVWVNPSVCRTLQLLQAVACAGVRVHSDGWVELGAECVRVDVCVCGQPRFALSRDHEYDGPKKQRSNTPHPRPRRSIGRSAGGIVGRCQS
jgi:hypothetical protein